MTLIDAIDAQGTNARANEEVIASTSGGLGEDRFLRFWRVDELTLPPAISEHVASEVVAAGEVGQSVLHGNGEAVQSSPLPQEGSPLGEYESAVVEAGSGKGGG